MRVVDYINSADPAKVVEFYRSIYNSDGWDNVGSFTRFKDILNQKIVEQSDMTVIVGKSSPLLEEEEEYIDVNGRDATGKIWSLSFVPWSQWKWMEVLDETNKNLSIDEIAAHIYYEITWYGWEEETEQRRDELLDTMEQFDKDLEAGTLKLIPLDDIKDIMKDKDSD